MPSKEPLRLELAPFAKTTAARLHHVLRGKRPLLVDLVSFSDRGPSCEIAMTRAGDKMSAA